MKRSEVVKELLNSYYFQHGRSADNRVITEAQKIIETFKKYEERLANKS